MQALLLLVCVLGFAGTEVCPVVTSGSVCKISLSPPCTFDLTDSPCDVLNITLEDSTNGSCIWRWKPDDSTNFQPASATSGPRFLSLDVSYVFEQANMELTIICRSSDAILGSIKFLLPAGKPTTQLVPQLTTKPPAAGPGKPTTPLVPQLTTKPPAGDSSLSSRGFSSTPSPPTGGAVPPPHLPPHIIKKIVGVVIGFIAAVVIVTIAVIALVCRRRRILPDEHAHPLPPVQADEESKESALDSPLKQQSSPSSSSVGRSERSS